MLALAPFVVVLLAYVAWGMRMLQYFRAGQRSLFCSLGAILGVIAPIAALAAVTIGHHLDDVVNAFPVLVLSWIAWLIAAIRGEPRAVLWPRRES